MEFRTLDMELLRVVDFQGPLCLRLLSGIET